MLDVHGEVRTRARGTGKPRSRKGVSARKGRIAVAETPERTQWTLKGIDKENSRTQPTRSAKKGHEVWRLGQRSSAHGGTRRLTYCGWAT